MTKMAAKWPNSIPKRLKNPTLWGRTYLYGPYKGVPPPPGGIHTYIHTYIHTLFGVLYIVHRQCPNKFTLEYTNLLTLRFIYVFPNFVTVMHMRDVRVGPMQEFLFLFVEKQTWKMVVLNSGGNLQTRFTFTSGNLIACF